MVTNRARELLTSVHRTRKQTTWHLVSSTTAQQLVSRIREFTHISADCRLVHGSYEVFLLLRGVQSETPRSAVHRLRVRGMGLLHRVNQHDGDLVTGIWFTRSPLA